MADFHYVFSRNYSKNVIRASQSSAMRIWHLIFLYKTISDENRRNEIPKSKFQILKKKILIFLQTGDNGTLKETVIFNERDARISPIDFFSLISWAHKQKSSLGFSPLKRGKFRKNYKRNERTKWWMKAFKVLKFVSKTYSVR